MVKRLQKTTPTFVTYLFTIFYDMKQVLENQDLSAWQIAGYEKGDRALWSAWQNGCFKSSLSLQAGDWGIIGGMCHPLIFRGAN